MYYLIYIIRQKLLEIHRLNHIVTLVWIPAHCGILGNETDYLAKNAISRGTPITDTIPHSDFYSISRIKYQENSTKFLKSQAHHKGKKYFQYFDGLQPKPWFHSFEVDREAIVTCVRIRSNHYSLNASLYRCNIIQDPSCHCGHPLQDVDHIFWHCPLFSVPREALIKQLLQHKIQPPFQIQDILRTPTLGVVNSIHSFIKKTGIHI